MASKKPLARRTASQARSKATVARILDSSAALIAERGADAVTMTQIARHARVVIGSLYQYFSDKAAIHQALLERHHSQVRRMLESQLSGVDSFATFEQRIEEMAEQYFVLHQTDPEFNGIWAAVQTDPQLQKMDAQDTMRNAAYLHAVVGPLLPRTDSNILLATCALLIQLAPTTSRFARELPPALRKHALPIFRRMIRDSLEALRKS